MQGLYQWQLTGNNVGEVERHILETQAADGADHDYFSTLIHGVPADLVRIDAAISPYLDRELQLVDPVERAILRLGAFELLDRPEVPWRVVISEAVELAKQFGGEQGHRYVNAILDRAAHAIRAVEIGANPGP